MWDHNLIERDIGCACTGCGRTFFTKGDYWIHIAELLDADVVARGLAEENERLRAFVNAVADSDVFPVADVHLRAHEVLHQG